MSRTFPRLKQFASNKEKPFQSQTIHFQIANRRTNLAKSFTRATFVPRIFTQNARARDTSSRVTQVKSWMTSDSKSTTQNRTNAKFAKPGTVGI